MYTMLLGLLRVTRNLLLFSFGSTFSFSYPRGRTNHSRNPYYVIYVLQLGQRTLQRYFNTRCLDATHYYPGENGEFLKWKRQMLSSRLDIIAVAHLLVKCYNFLCFSWYALKHAIFFSFT